MHVSFIFRTSTNNNLIMVKKYTGYTINFEISIRKKKYSKSNASSPNMWYLKE